MRSFLVQRVSLRQESCTSFHGYYFTFLVFCCCSLVGKSCLTFCDPRDCRPPGSSFYGISQAGIQKWVAISSSRGSSQPRDGNQVSCFAGRFFTSWAQGRPKNTGVGSLCLLQWIFPTQESTGGLLHCRRILYQMSYQGSLVY